MEIQVSRPVINVDFFSSGKPEWQIAKVGIICIDVSNGYKYKQIQSPQGSNWQLISKYNIVSLYIFDGEDDSLLLMGG